ncbi:hypothetical protein BaRGS_00010568 [Batillaria attramentaria]|uniref:Uncharacterized protein n=1 Tax=Batillaria attramentaria TaxID=370345 RepID=A0ABD0LFX5_9CAEN
MQQEPAPRRSHKRSSVRTRASKAKAIGKPNDPPPSRKKLKVTGTTTTRTSKESTTVPPRGNIRRARSHTHTRTRHGLHFRQTDSVALGPSPTPRHSSRPYSPRPWVPRPQSVSRRNILSTTPTGSQHWATPGVTRRRPNHFCLANGPVPVLCVRRPS